MDLLAVSQPVGHRPQLRRDAGRNFPLHPNGALTRTHSPGFHLASYSARSLHLTRYRSWHTLKWDLSSSLPSEWSSSAPSTPSLVRMSRPHMTLKGDIPGAGWIVTRYFCKFAVTNEARACPEIRADSIEFFTVRLNLSTSPQVCGE